MKTRPPSPPPGEYPGAAAPPEPTPNTEKTESAAPQSPPPDPPVPEAPPADAPPSDSGKLPGGDSAHRVEAVPHTWSDAEQKIAAVLAESIGLLIGRPQTLNWGSLNNDEKIPFLSVARKITSIK